MADFSLNSKELDIQAKYRDFAQRVVVPNRMKYDELAEFPWEIVKQAYAEGIMNGPVATKFGGNGYSVFESGLASEELGAACIGIGICIDANTLALTPMLLAANEEQQNRFFGQINEEKGVAAYCLTEPNAGSDVAGIKSTAIRHGDKYILNGHKRFITNGEVATFHTVFALTDPDKGARSLTAFVVPTSLPGIDIKPRMQKMGQKASVQNEIVYTNVEIPAENRLGEEGHGFLIAMKTFDRTRTGVAALSLGAAREAFEISMNWAKNRIQFGKPISANQAIGFMLADMATDVELARLITWKAAWAYDTGQRSAGLLSAMSKLAASDIAMRVATDAVQIMGGDGYSRDYPVEKIMRDVKLCQIYEGTNQVQRIVISKAILK
ncbi:MAG: acyl-CoA dehydrogenase family protein [Bacteroidetes bacterium]|nr:acyl-CoA dehydrogenase family protein [Bacteroidota bacterium]MBU1718208.1 acyl-CoA dehydrogenase family protein [Bacteroidota bacterium]